MANAQLVIPPGEWEAKILWDFDIQTDPLISAWRPDLLIFNKKENLLNTGVCFSGWPLGKIEKKKPIKKPKER